MFCLVRRPFCSTMRTAYSNTEYTLGRANSVVEPIVKDYESIERLRLTFNAATCFFVWWSERKSYWKSNIKPIGTLRVLAVCCATLEYWFTCSNRSNARVLIQQHVFRGGNEKLKFTAYSTHSLWRFSLVQVSFMSHFVFSYDCVCVFSSWKKIKFNLKMTPLWSDYLCVI